MLREATPDRHGHRTLRQLDEIQVALVRCPRVVVGVGNDRSVPRTRPMTRYISHYGFRPTGSGPPIAVVRRFSSRASGPQNSPTGRVEKSAFGEPFLLEKIGRS
jgi:hypothetical protein